MDYQNIYDTFYSKYYDKAELFTKLFFIKRQLQNRTFTTSFNHVSSYLNEYCVDNLCVLKNESLKELLTIFNKRYSIYAKNHIAEIFSNEIKINFDKLSSEIPKDYTYVKLIKEIAILQALNEISRLLSNNVRLFEMVFSLNEFENFAIKDYNVIALEDTEIYQSLHAKLYPKRENNMDSLGLNGTGLDAIELQKKNKIDLLFVNPIAYDCFLTYQKHIIDFYTDYSYLKKRLEKEQLIYNHKDNDFMQIIFKELQLISLKNYNEYCINGKLKSLQKSYSVQRENNFNIVFDALL